MTVEEIRLSVGDDSFPGRLNVPSDGGDRGILVLPGAGHGPYGDIFDRFAADAAESGFHVLRFQSWTTVDELGEKTLGDLHDEIDAALAFLRSRGCARIDVVAKSFGGGVALTHVPDVVERIVLWAPAIGVSDESNASKSLALDPRETALQIDVASLGEIDSSVRILHGDEDHIPIENSRELTDALTDATVVEVDGADHSFLGPDSGVDEVTVERTLDFLGKGE